MSISLCVSILVFLVIAMRQWLPSWIKIWHVMVSGALTLMVLGQISIPAALNAIDWPIIFYLLGVLIITAGIHQSGLSSRIARYFNKTGTFAGTLFVYMLFLSVLSMVLTNDASAIIAVPIALAIAKHYQKSPQVVLLAVCSTITVSSMVSPIGNPQNILIATSGYFSNPWSEFFRYLTGPTVVSLLFVFVWFLFYAKRSRGQLIGTAVDIEYNSSSSVRVYLAVGLFLFLLGCKILLSGHKYWLFNDGCMSLIAAAPLLCQKNATRTLLAAVDWGTLLFFMAMFIVTAAVLKSQVLQTTLDGVRNHLSAPLTVSSISLLASQIFSNVPLVDMYLHLLPDKSEKPLLLLASMSTIAGNLFIMSAASNVIVIQQSERYLQKTVNFWQFFLVNLPVTVVTVVCLYVSLG